LSTPSPQGNGSFTAAAVQPTAVQSAASGRVSRLRSSRPRTSRPPPIQSAAVSRCRSAGHRFDHMAHRRGWRLLPLRHLAGPRWDARWNALWNPRWNALWSPRWNAQWNAKPGANRHPSPTSRRGSPCSRAGSPPSRPVPRPAPPPHRARLRPHHGRRPRRRHHNSERADGISPRSSLPRGSGVRPRAVYGNDSGPRAAHSARCRRKLTRRVARQAQAPGDQRISGHRGQARDRRWSFVRQLALMVTQAALR